MKLDSLVNFESFLSIHSESFFKSSLQAGTREIVQGLGCIVRIQFNSWHNVVSKTPPHISLEVYKHHQCGPGNPQYDRALPPQILKVKCRTDRESLEAPRCLGDVWETQKNKNFKEQTRNIDQQQNTYLACMRSISFIGKNKEQERKRRKKRRGKGRAEEKERGWEVSGVDEKM